MYHLTMFALQFLLFLLLLCLLPVAATDSPEEIRGGNCRAQGGAGSGKGEDEVTADGFGTGVWGVGVVRT